MIIIRRVVGTAFFKRDSLLDIAVDQRATADAALLVSGVAGIGYLWDVMRGTDFSLRFLVSQLLNYLMIWIIMAGITLLIGKVLWKTETSMSTVMRLQGFCYLPLVLTYLTAPLALVGLIWFMAALVFVTAEALETVYWQATVAVAGSMAGLLVISQFIWGARLF